MSRFRGTAEADQGIGDQPISLGAGNLQLGWLDYKKVDLGGTTTAKIEPNSSSSTGTKAVVPC